MGHSHRSHSKHSVAAWLDHCGRLSYVVFRLLVVVECSSLTGVSRSVVGVRHGLASMAFLVGLECKVLVVVNQAVQLLIR